ncbi:MAG: T9SS type A sorting domain-containing protein [bacterium]
MKTKLILVVIVFIITNITNAYSQNHNIGKLKFVLNGVDSTVIDNTKADFTGPDSLVIGFQWGNEPSACKGIYANQNCVIKDFLFDNTHQSEANAAQEGAYLMISDYAFFTASLGDTSLCSSHSMTFEPNMLIESDDTQWDMIKNREGDSTRPIFGFKLINPSAVIPSDSNDTYYSCLIINSPSLINYPLFRKPFASEYLYRTGDDKFRVIFGNTKQKNYLGYNFCISVNLRRYLGESEVFPPGDIVLEIILPYTQHDSTKNYITFDGLPSDTIDSIYTTCNEYRGLKTRMIELTDTPTQHFYITKNMLPADGSPVTVTARFRCWGQEGTIPDFSNPMLSGPYTAYGPDIKKLGIYSIFRGGCPIAVDYVRVSTPYSVETFEGRHDAEIKDVIQKDIDSIAVYNTQHGTHLKVYRFNASTEGSVQNFDIERYVTKLVGNVFATTTTPIYPVLFDYYVQPPNRVLNCGFVGTSINAPYIEKGEKDNPFRYRTLGWIAGSTQGTYEDILSLDQQLNSGYETYYPYTSYDDRALGSHYSYSDFAPESLALHPKRIYELSWPDGDDSPTRAFQAFYQFQLWNIFNNEPRTGFQYCDKPWYFQAQNLTWWKIDTLTIKKTDFESSKININASGLNYKDLGTDVSFTVASFNSHGRPYTAEETRLYAYSAVGNGARGLYYDGVSYRKNEPFTRSAHFTPLDSLPIGSTDDRYEYLMRDDFGGDFFNLDNEKNPLDPLYFSKFDTVIFNFLNLNESKEDYAMANLGCRYDRIYAGRKSVRVELYKIHRLLMENTNTIMNLRLQAAYGKGIFKTYNQHPSYSPSERIIGRYVDTAHITTRKIFQPHTNLLDSIYTTVPYNTVEPEEEQFYDLTLFKYGQDSLINHMVIAIQNRRTDPLILVRTKEYPDTRELCFYAGSELDILADVGGYDPFDKNPLEIWRDTEYWRDLYRKRLGCREISLPIRRPSNNISTYYPNSWGYLVKDLTYKYPADYWSMKYWMQDAYNHQINKFVANTWSNIPEYDSVNIKLRPGEAKFLDIKRYYKIIPDNPNVICNTQSPIDTCDILNHGSSMGFIKVDTLDANNCVYELYYVNQSDSCDFYVPVSAEFITDDTRDTVFGLPLGFQLINIHKYHKFESIWLPDSVFTNVQLLGLYKAHCGNTKIIYKIGASDCYSKDSVNLPCHICQCSDSLRVSLNPINPLTMCRIIPSISQTYRLETGDSCKYYGVIVSAGFGTNTQVINDLSIFPDPLNPQPINFNLYNKWMDNPFMNIYCYPTCNYNMKFEFTNRDNDIVTSKDYRITIDNSQFPIDIDPSGLLSSQCYSIQPAKQNIPTEELHFEQSIIVDPNPTTGKANVKLNLENDLVGRLVLYTSTGELIKEIFNGKLPAGTSDYQIDLSSQPSGMYIITIESDGMQYIKKFVKE